jgi:hypothetical protein
MANPTLVGKAIYLLPGMSYKIESPLNEMNSMGFFARHGTVKLYGEDRTLTRGFVIKDVDVGDIELTSEEEVAIIYTHKRPEKNEIWFYALTGERGLIEVVSVPIHDHSSIVQGGPAYGTYFSDDIEAGEE